MGGGSPTRRWHLNVCPSPRLGGDQHAFHYPVSNSACNCDRDTRPLSQWLVSVTGSATARSPAQTERVGCHAYPPLLHVHAIGRDSVCPPEAFDDARTAEPPY